MPRFDMIRCAPELKLVIKGRYPPNKTTGEKPKILTGKGLNHRTSQQQILADSVISLGRSQESGLKALARGAKGDESNPIEVDNMYTFTFKRDGHITTFPTDKKQLRMGELMVEVQKDRSSGVFNFSHDEIKKLKTSELTLKFVPDNQAVKTKNISYSLRTFNQMTVLQFAKSVKDTDISISINLVPVAKTMSDYNIWE